MSIIENRLGLAIALGVTVLAASCQELPETQLKSQAGKAGAAMNAGGMAQSTGGKAASGGKGTAGSAGSAGNDTSLAGATANGGEGDDNAGSGGSGGSSSAGKGGKGGSGGKGSGGQSGGKAGTSSQSNGGEPQGGAGSTERTYSTDRGTFFGDSRCDTADVALCEDFESGSLDTARWATQGAAPTIETTRAARGSHSAHFHTEDNGLSLIRQTATFPAPGNTYYGRMFVWFDTMPTAPDWAHWTITGARHDGDDFEVRVGGQFDPNKNKNLFGVGTDGGPTGDWTNLDADNGSKVVPVQSWVCIEWAHKGDSNETQFWWDGVEHPSLATTESDHGGTDDPYDLPQFDSMWVGWWLYQTGTAPDHFDVWIDEVAVDYARIGCDI